MGIQQGHCIRKNEKTLIFLWRKYAGKIRVFGLIFFIYFFPSTLRQLELSSRPRWSCWCFATEWDEESGHWRKESSKFSGRPFVPCGCSVPSAYHSGSYRKVILVQTYSADLLAAALCIFYFSFLFLSVRNQLTAFFRVLSRHWRHQIRDSSPESVDCVTVRRHV